MGTLFLEDIKFDVLGEVVEVVRDQFLGNEEAGAEVPLEGDEGEQQDVDGDEGEQQDWGCSPSESVPPLRSCSR